METKDLLKQTKTRQEKKTWISPKILDSPVIAVTEGTYSGEGSDSGAYS